MSHSSRAPVAVAPPESRWLPAGWIAVGVVVARRFARRGHDPRTTLAVGIALCPLLVLLASDLVRGRQRDASPLGPEPGVDHGGDLEGDLDNEVASGGSSALLEAAALVPIEGAGLALHPGTLAAMADRCAAQPRRPLVLFAIGESPPGPASPGPG